MARGAGSFGSRGAARQRGPHLCTAQDWSETHEQRDVAKRTARSQRRVQQRTAGPRATDAMKTWGKAAGRATRRCRRRMGTTAANLARGAGKYLTPRRGATRCAGSLHGAIPEQDSQTTRCRKAHGEITTSCATAHSEAAGDGRDKDARQGGRPGSEALPAENGPNSLRIGTRRGQLSTLRRGAAPWAASLHAANDRRETREQRNVAMCRPGNETLPAKNRETRLRIWPVERASLDAAAHCTNAGRVRARRKTGARRASNARWRTTW